MMYVPILRGKLGEFKGLKNLSNNIKSQIRPLLRITDPDLDYDLSPPKWKCGHKEQFSRIAKYIGKHFENDIACFIDFETDPNVKILERHYSEFLFQELNKLGTNYAPVISFDRAEEDGYIDSIKTFGLLRGRDLCIRISKDYLEAISLHVDDIANLVSDVFPENNIYIVLDLEKIESITSAKSLAETAIKEITKKVHYEKLIISSACMPEKMSEFDSNEVSFQKRLDWDLWQVLVAKNDIVYSDYTVLNPSVQNINPKTMTRSSRIRYSDKDNVIIFKGESNKKTASKFQNPKLAKLVLKHASYKGCEFSWGDDYIKNCDEDTPGNATTWISAELNHHVTLVLEQISSYYGS